MAFSSTFNLLRTHQVTLLQRFFYDLKKENPNLNSTSRKQYQDKLTSAQLIPNKAALLILLQAEYKSNASVLGHSWILLQLGLNTAETNQTYLLIVSVE